MSDNRKYYYLKLKENYFDDDSIVLLESMQDGVLYSNILLKLYLKSLKHGGRLQLDEDIPYTAQMIATITRQQIGTVERALQIFLKLGLVEVLDSGTFYMSNIELLIGQSSTEAERKRAARLQNKALSALRTSGGHLSDIRPPEIEIELEKEIEIKREIEKVRPETGHPSHTYTPGHMDFLAEVYRSLAVLDGAILVISAKDGVQAQTRILFHALRKMNIPTVIFINKIDQAGVDLQSVVQSVRDKLSADIIIKQTVSLSPEIVLEENTDIEAWDAVIENNDELLEKYIAGEPISREKLAREEQQRVQDASLFPVYHGSAKNGLGIQPLMDAVTGLFQPIGEQGGAALCGSVFKVEYTDCGQRRVYLRLYSGTLRLRDTVALAGREKLKITEMRIPSKGEIVRTDTAYQGEIVILPSDSVRLNDVLGDQTRLPRKRWREDPLPMLRTTIAPKTAAQRERLLDALTQLADTDPLLRCEVDSITHEIILSFLGRVQLEVVSALLSEKYKLETVVKEPSVIYMERPLKAASHTIHIEVPPNPFWASIGLSVTPLSLGSGVQYESRVSLGYLNQSFQNAVRDGIRYGLEQGLFGWNVTDCKICFEYGLYYSPVSTPADFRSLAPIVLEQALKESGTQLLEPYLSFILYAPQEYLSRAYHDAPKYCATIETAQVKKDEVVFTGEIPARCIQAYRTDLAFYTNGRSVCLTELKGYQAAVGQPVIQPRRPNSRLDKVRHMFQKVM